jgi:hypothetical protein
MSTHQFRIMLAELALCLRSTQTRRVNQGWRVYDDRDSCDG